MTTWLALGVFWGKAGDLKRTSMFWEVQVGKREVGSLGISEVTEFTAVARDKTGKG